MLQIKNVRKEYVTGELKQVALDDVSLTLRDNEFVAILGPSGSGKTTLLNIVGGLDRYDSGDLIINGISTKKYKDRDWDSYRNHTIGFVFQSYNLIPHQSVLANVELALTISGISRSERRRRAKEALEKVGLGEQIHKRPNQMSGGQMQRVAIARALVNDPDILLADEPTGALDSDTSIQVMDMLAEVAKDRLVIMVTHNPELAERYATRIVKLKDGRITGDSDPCDEAEEEKPAEHKRMGKASMSRLTSLGLSFNNLRTKKGRTILTSFAGSIGIIGIALILSLSTGVNTYIENLQRSTMSSYPISIESTTIDMSALMEENGIGSNPFKVEEADHEMDAVYADGSDIESESDYQMSITENNLTAFKKYLDDKDSEIHKYVGENGIVYTYDIRFGIFTYDENGEFVNTDGSTLSETKQSLSMNSYQSLLGSDSYQFSQLLAGSNGSQVSTMIHDNYELVYGSFPESYDQVVLVMNSNNEVSATALYELGLLPSAEYKEMQQKIRDGEEVVFGVKKLDYEKVCSKEYYLIPQCDFFRKNEAGLYEDISGDDDMVKELMDNALKLKVCGIIREKPDTKTSFINTPFAYTKALTDYVIDYSANSEPAKAQEASKDTSIITGLHFVADTDEEKIADAKTYIKSLKVSEKAALYMAMIEGSDYMGDMDLSEYLGDTDISSIMGDVKISDLLGSMDLGGQETEMALAMDKYLEDPEDETLINIYDIYINSDDYESTLSELGAVSLDSPSSIDIYVDDFESKDAVAACIEDYNNGVPDEYRIVYTDYVGMLMSSVTTMVNAVSYVLIAFVAVSLIVSSIMIGIITYISVLERTKEIGILRAIGASKRNISQVFNAETFIIGAFSGLMGIGITMLILIPGNAVIHAMTDIGEMNAKLPAVDGLVLVGLSILLTLIGGFIPAKKAAKKDPVTALRSE